MIHIITARYTSKIITYINLLKFKSNLTVQVQFTIPVLTKEKMKQNVVK